jgi:hypothetical protein
MNILCGQASTYTSLVFQDNSFNIWTWFSPSLGLAIMSSTYTSISLCIMSWNRVTMALLAGGPNILQPKWHDLITKFPHGVVFFLSFTPFLSDCNLEIHQNMWRYMLHCQLTYLCAVDKLWFYLSFWVIPLYWTPIVDIWLPLENRCSTAFQFLPLLFLNRFASFY